MVNQGDASPHPSGDAHVKIKITMRPEDAFWAIKERERTFVLGKGMQSMCINARRPVPMSYAKIIVN